MTLYADDADLTATTRKVIHHFSQGTWKRVSTRTGCRRGAGGLLSTSQDTLRVRNRNQRPRLIKTFRQQTQFVEIGRYLGVNTTHVNQAGTLGVPINGSEMPIRHGVLMYKQFIHPMMENACTIWQSGARSHVRKLQILLRNANNTIS